jgi:ACT domain-containing protein
MDLPTMPGVEDASSAYLKIRAMARPRFKRSILRQVGEEKKLLVIEPIEAEAA